MESFHPKGRRAFRILLAAPLLAPLAAFAQLCDLPDFPDSTITSVQDRDRMLCQLGIAFPIMPPRIDDPNRPVNSTPTNPANTEGNWTDPRGHVVLRTNFGLWHTYDSDSGELGGALSGVGDYGPFSTPRYTDIKLLRMKNGSKVHDSEDWWLRRRPEIFKLVQQELYGKPIDPTIPVAWAVSAETTGIQVVGAASYPYRQKTFTGTVDKSSYPALRNTPVITAQCRYPAATGKRYPVVVTYGEGTARFQYTAPYDIGVCSYNPGGVQPDSGGANLSSYLIGLVTKGNWRKPDDPGSLVAWGWGISRLIDRLATDADLDGDKVGVQGHSRYGKATLVTAAYDERIVVAWPSDAGAMGTAMMRRHYGESLEFVASSSSEYHWVNGNILKYAGPLHEGGYIPRKVELLDVDAHSTTALLAPRAIFVTNGTDTPPGFGDAWADPRGTFLSGKLASPVWKLLGWTGQVIPEDTVFTSGLDESVGGTPPFNVAFIEGTVGWRRQVEGHVSTPNWPTFALFASRYLNDSRPAIDPDQKFTLGAGPVNVVGTVTASDADAADELRSWQVKGGSGAGIFDIRSRTGEIRIANPSGIDFRKATQYTLSVMAGDGNLASHDEVVTIDVPNKVNVCHQDRRDDHHGHKGHDDRKDDKDHKGHKGGSSGGNDHGHGGHGHNGGKTLYVARQSVPDHLRHGDSIGGCVK